MKKLKVYLRGLFVIVIIAMIIASVSVLFTACGDNNAPETGKDKSDVDFDDSCILVVMDKETSEINKVYPLSYFNDDNIESIEDLTYITGNIDDKKYLNKEEFKQILKLNLKVKSKQSVLDTIERIKNVPGVFAAEPNYYFDYID